MNAASCAVLMPLGMFFRSKSIRCYRRVLCYKIVIVDNERIDINQSVIEEELNGNRSLSLA